MMDMQGVSCDLFNGSWHVTALNIGPLYDNSLDCAPNANFSPHLFDLNHLKSLSFFNCFTFSRRTPLPIPPSNWEKLANTLETLEFRSNPGLTGPIPTAFATLKALQSLVLLENGLTGQLPTQLVSLVNLKRLVLAGNRLVGQISGLASWGTMTKLLILDLSKNSLSGPLPSSLGGLTSLLKLDLSNNFLERNFPEELGNLKNLTVLNLSNNRFSGGLTQSLQEMVSLEEMVLSNNPVGGELTRIQWENLQNLEFLDLSDMGLRGTVPESMAELKRLRFLGLNNNSLYGNLSPIFEAMPCITAIYLYGNNLTGKLGFSEKFYRKMGSRFRVSDNPNLCCSAELMELSRNVRPFGVAVCQEGKSFAADGNRKQGSNFVASLGLSSCCGKGLLRDFMEKEVLLLVLWTLLL
ncbi:hypothetical protein U1Q18_005086 [Sarracenia purpurea var. burkii]